MGTRLLLLLCFLASPAIASSVVEDLESFGKAIEASTVDSAIKFRKAE